MAQVMSAYCDYCKRDVRAECRPINHILHLLLTIFTLGLWIFVWGYQGFKGRNYYCATCGHQIVWSD